MSFFPKRQWVKPLCMLLFAGFVSIANPVMAACTGPTGPEGAILYNSAQNVPQICTDQGWIALGILNPAAGGGGCSGPTSVEGAILYNSDYHVPQYCDGSSWITMIGNTGASYAPASLYDFESNSLSGFVTGGDLPWTVTSSGPAPYAGTYSARTGAIADNQSTSLILYVELSAPMTVKFWLWTDTESGYDFVYFFDNGAQLASWSGANTTWAQQSYALSAGNHVLEWKYVKDGGAVGGTDRAAVDDITFQ